MNKPIKLKPNLVDPELIRKIKKTLRPPQEDYWEPTKNTFQTLYDNYIVPNISIIIVIIIIIVILVYRYYMVKREREQKKLMQKNTPKQQINSQYNLQQQYNSQYNLQQQQMQMQPQLPIVNEDQKQAVMNLYNQTKEAEREIAVQKRNNKHGFAYPMYPYVKGGTLTPSGKKA